MLDRNTVLALARPWYTGVDRHYHDWRHIEELFAFADQHQLPLRDAETLAIAFHDAIYIPLAGDNERKSADLAMLVADHLTLPPETRAEVETLILATAHRGPTPPAAARVVSLDLLRLAAPEPAFLDNVTALHREYAAHFPDLDAYRRAWAIHIAKPLLARQPIYPDAEIRQLLETDAVARLTWFAQKFGGPG